MTKLCANGLHPMTGRNVIVTRKKRVDGTEYLGSRCRACKNKSDTAKDLEARSTKPPTARGQRLPRTRTTGWPNSWILAKPTDKVVHRLWWGDHYLQCGAHLTLLSTPAPAGIKPCTHCWESVIGDGATEVLSGHTVNGAWQHTPTNPIPSSAVIE